MFAVCSYYVKRHSLLFLRRFSLADAGASAFRSNKISSAVEGFSAGTPEGTLSSFEILRCFIKTLANEVEALLGTIGIAGGCDIFALYNKNLSFAE